MKFVFLPLMCLVSFIIRPANERKREGTVFYLYIYTELLLSFKLQNDKDHQTHIFQDQNKIIHINTLQTSKIDK